MIDSVDARIVVEILLLRVSVSNNRVGLYLHFSIRIRCLRIEKLIIFPLSKKLLLRPNLMLMRQYSENDDHT